MRPGWCIAAAFLWAALGASGQSFRPGGSYAAQNGPQGVSAADFNGDGKLDLAVANSASSTISIFLGNGDGTFTPGQTIEIPGGCLVTSTIPGEFTGDGKVDLLAVCGFQSTIWVAPGLGGGQFGTPISTKLPQLAFVGFAEASLWAAAAADFNGDGKLDLAIGLGNADFSNCNLSILPGNGNGTFQPPSAPLTNLAVVNVVATDMNGDGKPDLVLAGTEILGLNADATVVPGDSFMEVFLNDGKGGFHQSAKVTLPGLGLAGNLAVADLNGDGVPDVVTASGVPTGSDSSNSPPASVLAVYTGKGDGTLAPTFTSQIEDFIMGIIAGDFRGIGTTDLIECYLTNLGADSPDVNIGFRAGNGDGTFQSLVPVPVTGGITPFWYGMLAADFNGDGLLDFAFPSLPTVAFLAASNASGLTSASQLIDELGAGSVAVMLNTATPPPLISVSNPQLQFTYAADRTAPAGQPIAISNRRSGTFGWTARTDQSWLTVAPASGTAPGSVQVSVAGGLPANTYSGNVLIMAAGASNSPLKIPVSLVVSAATTNPVILSVVNGASFQPGIESGSWVTIKGTNLANTPGQPWTGNDIVNGNLPTSLAGTSVTIDGKPAYTSYVSGGQINVQAPTDSAAGTVEVVVENNGKVSQPFPVTLQQSSPAFFQYPLTPYAIATRYPDNALIGNPATITGTVAAKPGDILILWATGFGPTSPSTPAGIVVTGAPAAATLPTVTVGGTATKVISAVLSPGSAGLYQVAIQLSASVPAGTEAIQCSVAGISSPGGVDLFVGN